MKYAKKFSSMEDYGTWRCGSNYQIPSVTYVPGESAVIYHKFFDSNNYDYVDLALPSGTMWATMNLGAQSSSDPGDYIAWGELYSKDTYTNEEYYFYNGPDTEYWKYNSSDNTSTLSQSDDAAYDYLNGDWHIPTEEQWRELVAYTDMTSAASGCTFTGGNGNSIFLPSTGYMSGTTLTSFGDLWYQANSIDINLQRTVAFVHFNGNNYLGIASGYRYEGYVIRPVLGKGRTPRYMQGSGGENPGEVIK